MPQKNREAISQLRSAIGEMTSIPESEWVFAVSFMTMRAFDKGAFLVRAGEYLEHFYFIVRGLVRFYYSTEDGKTYNKHFAMEDGFAGSLHSFILRTPCPFSIQALEPADTIVLPNSELRKLFDRHSCWERLGRKNAERLALLKEEREKAFLLDSLEGRYRHFLKAYPTLPDRIAQYHIASYLGVTDVALSRIRKNHKF